MGLLTLNEGTFRGQRSGYPAHLDFANYACYIRTMGRGRELENAAELRRAFDLLGRLLAASSETAAVAVAGGSGDV